MVSTSYCCMALASGYLRLHEQIHDFLKNYQFALRVIRITRKEAPPLSFYLLYLYPFKSNGGLLGLNFGIFEE